MQNETLEKVKQLFSEGKSSNKEVLDLLHELFEGVLLKAYDQHKDLGSDLIVNSYSIALSEVIHQLEQKKIPFPKALSIFSDLFQDLIFDHRMKAQLAENDSLQKSVLVTCRKRFQNIIATASPIPINVSAEKDAIFHKAFKHFEHAIKQKNYGTQTLQALFLSRFSDVAAIHFLLNHGNNHEHWLNAIERLNTTKSIFLYKYELLRKGTNEITIDDLFNEAVLTLEKNIRNQSFKGESSLKTYFTAIFNHKCIDRCRKLSTKEEQAVEIDAEHFKNMSHAEKRHDVILEEKDFIQRFKQQFETAILALDKKCKKLLPLVAQRLSNFSIKEILKWDSESQVRTKKPSCLKKLKEQLPLLKERSNQNIIDVLILFHNEKF